mgnify:CR=1 FL=1
MSKRDDEPEQPTAPFWMATFSDMMTLLLVMFVMIVSMSEVEVKKFREALSYFQGGSGILEQTSLTPSVPKIQRRPFDSREQARKYQELIQYLKEQGLEDKVQVELSPEGIRTTITDSVMFRTGRAELIEPARTILSMLAGVMDRNIKAVAVEGHTDSLPIRTNRFPSNWELSSARASSVVRFLQKQEDVLDPGRYVTLGYGEHRPVAPNETVGGRAKNRRVEILFRWTSWPTKSTPPNQMLPNNEEPLLPTMKPMADPAAGS